ncbi:MAG: UDP-N-acetylmuramoylalanyl-D-glutamyl-2,6-diaminopimelate--D-alanyl-D-alanine ligase [Rhodospirillales bacterium]|jgi:UDP-N-acetylmuramoyl-tripeptide--D-alanyl-D-alanine ligase|nr:UDP-N-acetylmuramoylalanyl-D-glutamyl-2,6-diaminopimelate--D-alanyl-D-alanine ligase [Rhodospirillales bacterium]
MNQGSTYLSSQTISQALDCVIEDDWAGSGVSIDSRTLEMGDLFVALQGPTHDGHDYVVKALEKGAIAAVVSHRPENCSDDARLLFTPDTMIALENLGVAARDGMNGKVIAVTGSVGKTGTKEMLRLALSNQGVVTASDGNLNNHYGVPLSLSRMKAETKFGIFEVGMNHPGEIRPLVRMVRPHVAIVTAIEAAHTEFFSSVEQIADAKAEIFEGLEPGGVAIINQDSEFYERLADAARVAGAKNIIGFGGNPDSQARLINVNMQGETSFVEANIDGVFVDYELGVPGMHHVMNSLAVLAAISAAGGNVKTSATCLVKFRPLKGRGVRTVIKLDDGSDVVLIDESYNASPASMQASLDVVGRIEPSGSGRRIAVLGDMLELGLDTAELHRNLVTNLESNNFDLVFACGQHMLELWNTLPQSMRGGYSISPEKLSMVVISSLRNGDVVVAKGSLGSRVGVVVNALLELGEG